MKLLAGGIQAWKAAGLPVKEDKPSRAVNAPVQIAAGVLILLGVALGYSVSSGFFLLSAFVGAGLTFAGITGFAGWRACWPSCPGTDADACAIRPVVCGYPATLK